MTTANKIRSRRKQLGMTQQDLAAKIGYKNRSTITKIEKGETDLTQGQIVLLVNALNVSVEYLMDFRESPDYIPENIISPDVRKIKSCKLSSGL